MKSSTPNSGGTPGKSGERIAKVIARAGLCSRRDAERWIADGRVSVNGRRITSAALNVSDADAIVVDGQPLPARERSRLWIHHKPRGVVTTARDPQGRKTVFSALPSGLPRLMAVGRLDINTEGLLLLTNDGGLARILELPSTGWLRRYRVRAHGTADESRLDVVRGGAVIDGVHYGPADIEVERVQGANVWLLVGLREGKNREVKRLLEHIGLTTNRLIRVSFGPFQLGDLAPRGIREVSGKVVRDQLGAKLAAEAGLDFEAPVRPARSEGSAAAGRPRRPHRARRRG